MNEEVIWRDRLLKGLVWGKLIGDFVIFYGDSSRIIELDFAFKYVNYDGIFIN